MLCCTGMSFTGRVKTSLKNVAKGAKKLVDIGSTHFATPEGLNQVGRAGKAVSSVLPFERERNLLGGAITGGAVGRVVGGSIGKAIGTLTGNREKGEAIGSKFGQSVLGFKKGGRVKKSGKYLVHKSEFVVPKKGKITKKQKSKVAKRHK